MRVIRIIVLKAMTVGLLAGVVAAAPASPDAAQPMDQPSVDKEPDVVNLLFIHHSTGGTLLADPGPQVGGERGSGERCIYVSHPNGGGLRGLIEARGIEVNELSYESELGEDTDVCHWHEKFSNHLDRIIRTKRQDTLLPEGESNQVVMFKSCYPNNWFDGRGDEPGDPDDCTRTVANAKAAYRSLLPHFAEHPDVLFVAFTVPPMVEYQPVGLKNTIKSWFKDNTRGAKYAREFNTWMADRENGWLAEFDRKNVVVFDYYDILTGSGEGDNLAYPSRPNDSHPSSEGNQKAAAAFMPFLEQAVVPMGWAIP